MTHIEMVEKLRERADVNYADAKDALERADWDLLDAMILLEREGKIRGETGICPTAAPEGGGDKTGERQSGSGEKSAGEDQGGAGAKAAETPGATTFREFMGKLFRGLKKLVHLGNINLFVVERGGESSLRVPVTVLVILLILGFWVVVPLLILGLFFGYRYGFEGPHLGRDNINGAMHKATDVAEDIKSEFKKTQDK